MEHAGSLAVGMCFGVGGLFDFLAGERRRAPRWLRQAGLEWVFRFVMDPASKWDRVLIEIPLYVLRVVAARLFKRPMVSTTPQLYAENQGEV
jgi:N-acetylglucosaminyldiphosphoundecaprenol N-acetyl-beta-D-mannosaminyltransferase